ncbi:DUF2125 domain-containing protein [Tropicimonas sp. IMCC34043]|uniref:DUF2125 domain-containing protein n=1 Tax=Tropicimonas sp. IMCC34043 TaxID=2248760 RepID=UPI0013007DE6|nr:DUF2125 domain-containing protein [Tropicimonas sp. IMCC34043]
MKPMRLLWLVLLVAVAWGLWWGWGVWTTSRNVHAWLNERRAAGWQAEWSDISIQGFPTRIDTTISDLTLANTEAGWVWSTPFLQILGLNYENNHYVLVSADTMTLQTPYERIEMTGEDLRGSVNFLPGQARAIDEAVAIFKDLSLVSDAGWAGTVAETRLAVRPTAGRDGWYDLGVEVSGLTPGSGPLARLAGMGMAPGTIERLNADLALRLDRPLDRTALEGLTPQPREIDIRDLGARWGQLDLRVAGDLTLDAAGQVSGEILVKATNWRDMLELLRESGSVPGAVVSGLESALQIASGFAGSKKTLDIPVTFRNGRTRIGILPVGPAPVLRLR